MNRPDNLPPAVSLGGGEAWGLGGGEAWGLLGAARAQVGWHLSGPLVTPKVTNFPGLPFPFAQPSPVAQKHTLID